MNRHLNEEIVRQAIETLGKSFDVTANRLGIGSSDTRLEIIFKLSGRKLRKSFEIETNKPTRAVINQLIMKQKKTEGKVLLITDYVSSGTADLLREQEISFVDTSGNAFFNEIPEFYIFISGRLREPGIMIPKSNLLFQPSGLKLLFVLLSLPNSENKTYRELEELSGVSLGSVNEVMANLLRNFYLVGEGKERLLVKKKALLDRWVQGYAETLRPKLRKMYFETTLQDKWKEIDLTKNKAVWGGEVAADELTKYLVPFKFTLYTKNLSQTFRHLLQMGFKRVPEGNIEVLETFWNFDKDEQYAPPLLVYADLLASSDARNLEVAQIIYDQYLARLVE